MLKRYLIFSNKIIKNGVSPQLDIQIKKFEIKPKKSQIKSKTITHEINNSNGKNASVNKNDDKWRPLSELDKENNQARRRRLPSLLYENKVFCDAVLPTQLLLRQFSKYPQRHKSTVIKSFLLRLFFIL
jgi:hypothetical protein